MLKQKRVWIFIGFGCLILLVAVLKKLKPVLNVRLSAHAEGLSKGSDSLPVLGKLTPFTLKDQFGQSFTHEDLSGKIWLADFIFTTCAGPCPVMSSQFSELQQRFSKYGDLRLLSVSVNPEYDTPEVLKTYGDKYGANHERWIFLTGDRNEIHKLAVEGFHVGSVENPVFHSTYFILLDKEGNIRGYYTSSDLNDMKKLWSDARSLLKSS